MAIEIVLAAIRRKTASMTRAEVEETSVEEEIFELFQRRVDDMYVSQICVALELGVPEVHRALDSLQAQGRVIPMPRPGQVTWDKFDQPWGLGSR